MAIAAAAAVEGPENGQRHTKRSSNSINFSKLEPDEEAAAAVRYTNRGAKKWGAVGLPRKRRGAATAAAAAASHFLYAAVAEFLSTAAAAAATET